MRMCIMRHGLRLGAFKDVLNGQLELFFSCLGVFVLIVELLDRQDA